MARIAAVLLLLIALEWETRKTQATEQMTPSTHNYYVAPDGSDQNTGTLESPWQTLEYALTQVSPGDVLNLRGGTYYERGITVSTTGTGSAPITIRSYPGERAVIDGGVPFFMDVPNTEWELVNEDLHLYRSRRTFPDASDFVRAWLVDDDVQLVEYESAQNLESTNYGPLDGTKPLYMGPGIQLREDGHLYIRLVYNPNDLTDAAGAPIDPIPSDVDPNHNRIAVWFSDYLIRLDSAMYLHIKGLELAHARYILDVRNGSDHLQLSDCRIRFGTYGIVIRDPVHDWEISGCEFTNGVPDYIYWTDVKNRDQEVAEAYPEFQSVAITGPMVNTYIHHNLFRNTFDALDIEQGARNTQITDNAFKHVRDDAINLSRGISNVEVAHNLIWHGMGGISNLASDAPPGPVYIHHNVIDNSAYQRGGRPGNYREDNWPVWSIGSPFPGHDDGNKDSQWKLYNNTVVTRQDTGHRWGAAGPDEVTGNHRKLVLNNIFYVMDERVIFRDDHVSDGSRYDGNVFYQGKSGTLPLFLNFGDGGEYDSLAEFQANSGTDWERNGLEIDPGFDLSALNDPSFDPAQVWERYRPSAPEIFTVGAPYDEVNWPGAQGVDYRGALPGPPAAHQSPPPEHSQPFEQFLPVMQLGLRFSKEFAALNALRASVLMEGYSYVR